MQIGGKNDACSSGARDNELEIASLVREGADLCVSRVKMRGAKREERRRRDRGRPIMSASAPCTYDRGGDVV